MESFAFLQRTDFGKHARIVMIFLHFLLCFKLLCCAFLALNWLVFYSWLDLVSVTMLKATLDPIHLTLQ
jgi:hypothetical protein